MCVEQSLKIGRGTGGAWVSGRAPTHAPLVKDRGEWGEFYSPRILRKWCYITRARVVCVCARDARVGEVPPPLPPLPPQKSTRERVRYAEGMTRYLGKPEPLPYVDEEDLYGLASDLSAGHFSSAEVYDWHTKLLEREGRKPVDRKTFGLALKEAGWKSSVRRIDGKPTRCWLITRGFERKALAHFASPPQP